LKAETDSVPVTGIIVFLASVIFAPGDALVFTPISNCNSYITILCRFADVPLSAAGSATISAERITTFPVDMAFHPEMFVFQKFLELLSFSQAGCQ